MLSKYLPWDFIQKYPTSIIENKLGVYAFLTEEPFLERLLLDQLPKKNLDFLHYSGNEFTRDFIEEHFINLSFFSSAEHLIVLNAETIAPAALEFFIENVDVTDRFLILIFNKSNKSFIEFTKNERINGIHLQSPSPFQGKMLWTFCMRIKGVKFDGFVSDFALSHLEHNFESFILFIDQLKVQFPEGKIDHAMLKNLISRERWDYFELIDCFHKNPKLLLLELLSHELDFEWFREISSKFQIHIMKLLFPQELMANTKSSSRYNQTIIDLSKRLDRKLLKSYLNLFIELEIMAKKKDELLLDKIRLVQLGN